MRKVLLTIAIVFCLVPLSAQEQTGVENAILDAVMQIEEGRIDSAGQLLDSLHKVSPSNDAVLYYKGLCRYAKRDYSGAITDIKAASELDPSNNWYLETLANLYIYTGEPAEAGVLYKTLSVRNPDKFRNSYTLSLMADAYRLKRDYPGFFGVLKELVQDPNIDDDQKYQALMGSLGNFDARTFKAIVPQMDSLMTLYAAAEPSSVHAHSLCLQMAVERADNAAVIRESEILMALQPDDTEAQLTGLSIIGDTYHSMGQSRKAYKTYEEALKINPRYCPVLNNYAYYLSEERRKLCKASRMSRITVEEEPDNATYLDTYGWILYLRGKAKEAKPYFKHAMIYGGKESEVILRHYSKVLEKLGEKNLAEYYRGLADNKKK